LEFNQGLGPLHEGNVMASLDLSGVMSAINTAVSGTAGQSLTGAEQQIFSAVAVGAISGALLKALQHPDVQGALNPLGITVPGLPAASAPPAAPVASSTPVLNATAKTMNAAWVSANSAAVAAMLGTGYTIVP
jgi:hypothetical protein